ncbi:MAG: hypothetical protein QXT50_01845 [Thermofilum sp.]
MERLASGGGRKGLRARLEERVERRGAELQQLFGEYGLGCLHLFSTVGAVKQHVCG